MRNRDRNCNCIRIFSMVRRRIISTLCPKRLPPADFVNLSGRLQPRVTVPRFGTAQFFYAIDNVAHRLKPFPPGTHGFFYYYTPPKAPPFVGEVRFRRASDPDSFEGGKDLLSPDETPWSLSLYALANRGSHAVLRNQLVHDGLISPAALEKWAQHSENRSPTAAMLYYLRQPFIYRFDRHFLSLYAVTREKINFCHEISFTRGISGRGVPYSGALLSWVGVCHNNFVQEVVWSNSNVTATTRWPCAFSKY